MVKRRDLDRLQDSIDQARGLPESERQAFLIERLSSDDSLRGLLSQTGGPNGDTERSAVQRRLDRNPVRPGDAFGPFRILSELGRGGMGVVYLAEQTAPVRRKVALKVLYSESGGEAIQHRLEGERQALALMNHTCIARFYDAGQIDVLPYFAMEHIPGRPIVEVCDARRMPVRERLELLARICDGVHHAHQKGIIHRDLKSSNVLVSEEDGRPMPKIIDFGIAKAVDRKITEETLVTEAGAVLGTPAYMSPEQLAGGPDVDVRTDVYALGALMYKLVVGRLPFDLAGLTFPNILAVVIDKEPQAPHRRFGDLESEAAREIAEKRGTTPAALARRLDGEIAWILRKALEKEPANRYTSAAEFGLDVRNLLANKPLLAGPPSGAYYARKLVSRHRTFVAAGLIALLAILSGAVAAGLGYRQAVLAREQAELEAARAEAVSGFLSDMLKSADPDQMGREAKLVDVMERAVSTLEETPPDRVEVEVDLRSKLALTYAHLGLFDDAESLGRSAVRLAESKLGELDYSRLKAAGLLAQIELELGKFDVAAERLSEILDLQRQAGAGYREIAETQDALAAAYWFSDQLELALPLIVDLRERAERLLGPDDPETMMFTHHEALVLRDLARIGSPLGNREKALELLRRWAEFTSEYHGPAHPDALIAVNELANMTIHDDPEGTLRLMSEAYELAGRELGPRDIDTLLIGHNLGFYLLEAQQPEKAVEQLEEVCTARIEVYGDDAYHTVLTERYLVEALLAAGQPERAVAMVDLRLDSGPIDDEAYRQIAARAMFRMGRDDDSRRLCVEGIEENPDNLSLKLTDAVLRSMAGDQAAAERAFKEVDFSDSRWCEEGPRALRDLGARMPLEWREVVEKASDCD